MSLIFFSLVLLWVFDIFPLERWFNARNNLYAGSLHATTQFAMAIVVSLARTDATGSRFSAPRARLALVTIAIAEHIVCALLLLFCAWSLLLIKRQRRIVIFRGPRHNIVAVGLFFVIENVFLALLCCFIVLILCGVVGVANASKASASFRAVLPEFRSASAVVGGQDDWR